VVLASNTAHAADGPPPLTHRRFGFILVAWCGMTAIWPVFRGESARGWALAAAAFFLAIALLRPGLLAPLHAAFQWLVQRLGIVLLTVVTLLLYLCLFLPIGLSMRTGLRRRLGFRFDPEASSYWVPRDAGAPASDMRQQF
jgi:hypothetical protein